MSSLLDSWLTQHAAGERELNKLLLKFYKSENAKIIEALGDHPTPSGVENAVHASTMRDAMLKAIGPTLLKFMGDGAATVVKQVASPRKRKAAADPLADFKLPARVTQALENAFKKLEDQDYWLEIQLNYSERIADYIHYAIEEGFSGSKLAKTLRETMDGMSKVQSMAIARTETTLVYNAGHQAAYDELKADGEIKGKQWLAVSDKDTRESHSQADGQEVAADEDFSVGGESAPYPGHWSLSPEERVNCRCATIAILNE